MLLYRWPKVTMLDFGAFRSLSKPFSSLSRNKHKSDQGCALNGHTKQQALNRGCPVTLLANYHSDWWPSQGNKTPAEYHKWPRNSPLSLDWLLLKCHRTPNPQSALRATIQGMACHSLSMSSLSSSRNQTYLRSSHGSWSLSILTRAGHWKERWYLGP